ncbi:hypothetical protein C7M45_01925 [Leuconostoc mesenteroides]|nr:hypothetical protein C7M45_01925 [Leuconostoc mesenteroides]
MKVKYYFKNFTDKIGSMEYYIIYVFLVEDN